MAELTIQAKKEYLDDVLGFIEKELEQYDCPAKTMTQIQIAVEEIYVNIASYAYNPKDGPATIMVSVGGEPLQVILTFIDNGKPYNPLEREDPDITLGAAERQIGGLGIFMVKKSMDNVDYRYENGSNILTIKKNLG